MLHGGRTACSVADSVEKPTEGSGFHGKAISTAVEIFRSALTEMRMGAADRADALHGRLIA
jgi:hypothetical protein